jgi:thiamine pyrophosphate-dependent acetolactate synthase large subunit-like protein
MSAKIDRRLLLGRLFAAPDDYLYVSGLAGSARDLAALTNDGPALFALGGVMGAASMIGLGMALAAPARKIAVVTGDGELQMNVGSLITIASAAPDNLTIICVDNECHGETGNQVGHTGRRTDLGTLARGAGLASVMMIAREQEIPVAAKFIEEAPGPRLVLVKVADTEPTPFKRLMDPPACRYRFKAAFMGDQSRKVS